jgi:predicted  nucleic acid-binding Zn-ribbon protein
MPHQCVKCGRVIPVATKELLEGCANCKSKFFFYIREEQLEAAKEKLIEIPEKEKTKIEKDVRDIAGIKEEDVPVILDFESVRITGSGKFEIDLAKIFNKKRPLVYKLEEGKYIIDLSTALSEKEEK